MSEYVTDEAVEKVRDELAGATIGSGYYATPIALDEAEELARIALEAAAPLIAAKALRDAAHYGPLHFAATHRDQWSRGRLLVTQAWLRARADEIARADS